MSEQTSAVIICESVFLRDIITDNLFDRGIEVLVTGSSFADVPIDCQPDVAVIIETAPGELLTPKMDVQTLARRFARWLCIGTTEEGSVFRAVRAIRSDVSGVPLDIGKDDVFHAVTLAAGANSVCIGGTCRNCPSKERSRLNEANLDPGQWQILQMLADGATNKHIAKRFQCNENKVKGMIRRLLSAIDASNRTQAAVMAARAGL